jgi:uncharacterized membrane protein
MKLATQKKLWLLCCILAALIAIAGFTPFAIPENTFHPQFMGMPYPLWISMLLSVLLVLLTFLGTLVHPGNSKTDEE